jgi:hypothetical protein
VAGVPVAADGYKGSPLGCICGFHAGAEVRPAVAPTEFTLDVEMRPSSA